MGGRAERRKQRRRERQQSRRPPGVRPGTLIADPNAPPPVVRVMAFGDESFCEDSHVSVERLGDYLEKWPVTWVNVEGLGDAALIARIGEIFGLHPLALEDVINVNQRAKVEQYDGRLFIVARMAHQAPPIDTEQVSLFLGPRFVLTFQEGHPGDTLEPVRARIRQDRGKIRDAGPDYLAYALLDAVIDGYFPALEDLGEQLEDLEDAIVERPSREAVARIHAVKRELLAMRRAMWPLREVVNTLIRDETKLIGSETRLYLRDCYDHTVRIIELVETYRELCSDLMDLYLSSVSIRMNEVVKVLTIISTIFMPLTFVAGIYGMNFRPEASPLNMPELNWYWGYPFALSLFAIIAIGLLTLFWLRGWIGRKGDK